MKGGEEYLAVCQAACFPAFIDRVVLGANSRALGEGVVASAEAASSDCRIRCTLRNDGCKRPQAAAALKHGFCGVVGETNVGSAARLEHFLRIMQKLQIILLNYSVKVRAELRCTGRLYNVLWFMSIYQKEKPQRIDVLASEPAGVSPLELVEDARIFALVMTAHGSVIPCEIRSAKRNQPSQAH